METSLHRDLKAIYAGEHARTEVRFGRYRIDVVDSPAAELELEVDSLKKEALAVETDPLVQERLARELYGMLRPGEFVYNILWDDGKKE